MKYFSDCENILIAGLAGGKCAMLTMELQPAVHMQHMGHGLAAGDQHHQVLMSNNQTHMHHQDDEASKKKQREYRHQMPYEPGKHYNTTFNAHKYVP